MSTERKSNRSFAASRKAIVKAKPLSFTGHLNQMIKSIPSEPTAEQVDKLAQLLNSLVKLCPDVNAVQTTVGKARLDVTDEYKSRQERKVLKHKRKKEVEATILSRFGMPIEQHRKTYRIPGQVFTDLSVDLETFKFQDQSFLVRKD